MDKQVRKCSLPLGPSIPEKRKRASEGDKGGSRKETQRVKARKDDGGKLRWSLLPWSALSLVVEVLEYGAKKYAPNQWKEVDNAEERYREALFRHMVAFASGELIDPESGKPHLAHIVCNGLFLLHFLYQSKE